MLQITGYVALQRTTLEDGVLCTEPHTVLSTLPTARQIPAGADWLYQVGSHEATLSPPPSTAWLRSHTFHFLSWAALQILC